MNRKTVSGIMLTLLLTGLLTLAFNIESAKAEAVNSTNLGESIYTRIENPNPVTAEGTVIWYVSPTDFGTVNVMPGQSVDLVVTISNDPASDTAWNWNEISFGPWYGNYGDYDSVEFPPEIDPGNSWTGTIGTFTVFPTTPWGTQVTAEGCVLEIHCWNPGAQPAFYSIPITIIAGLSQPITIYTDKYSYSAGDTMYLGLDINNPVSYPITVCIAIWLVRPVGPVIVILHAHAVTLPGDFTYSNPAFMSFTLPSIPAGIYTWHAAFLKPSTHPILVEDTAEWEFT